MKIKQIHLILIILEISFLLILSGCTKQKYICSTGDSGYSVSSCPVCGDNKCTGLESDCNCPSDCYPEPEGVMTFQECSEKFPVFSSTTKGCTHLGTGCTHYDWNN